jgi:O-antigen/teichoic acid export membrane protein
MMLGGSLVGHALRFASNLAMVRILDDERYFRQQALIVAMLQLLELLTDVGIWLSIVRSPRGLEGRFLNTAWTVQVLRGALLCAVGISLAPVFAAFYGDPELETLVCFASIAMLLGGFVSPKLYVRRRQLRVRSLLAIDIGSQVVGIVGTISYAMIHPSAMAFVVGGMGACFARVVSSHLLPGPKAGFGWDRTVLREICHVGVWTLLNTGLTFAAMQDRLILGRLAGDSELGVYYIAWIIAQVPTGMISALSWSVVLPMASRLMRSGTEPAVQLLLQRRPILLLGGWSLSVLAACSPSLISILYPANYRDAEWMLRWISIGMWLGVILEQSRAALFASVGRLYWSSGASVVKLLALAAFVPLGFELGGFEGAVLGFIVAEVPRLATTWMLAHRAGAAGVHQDVGMSAIFLTALFCGSQIESYVGSASGSGIVAIIAATMVATLVWLPFSWRDVRGFARAG